MRNSPEDYATWVADPSNFNFSGRCVYTRKNIELFEIHVSLVQRSHSKMQLLIRFIF